MKVLNQLKRALSCSVLLAASLFLAGCEHLYYADPNPEKPFVFPGQNTSMAAAPVAPPAAVPAPTGLSPVSPGYTPNAPVAPPTQLPAPVNAAANPLNSSILQKGDVVTVSFADLPPPGMPEQKQRIADDGKLILPLGVVVQAEGKTSFQLQQEIQGLYVPRYFVRLTVSVKPEERWYYVGGEVKLANRFLYSGDITTLRAIDTAGGFTEFANRKKIEVRRANGQKYTINWNDAIKDSSKDVVIFPNDQIIVHKKAW